MSGGDPVRRDEIRRGHGTVAIQRRLGGRVAVPALCHGYHNPRLQGLEVATPIGRHTRGIILILLEEFLEKREACRPR